MRFAPIALPAALLLAPLLLAATTAHAQTTPPPDATGPGTSAPTITVPNTPPAATSRPRGVTREQFVQRAAENAGRRFDEMDTNHDGLLEPAEIRAWREAHGMAPPPQITVHSAPATQ